MVPTGDLDDPGFNIELGTRFLSGLMREFNDPGWRLAAYKRLTHSGARALPRGIDDM